MPRTTGTIQRALPTSAPARAAKPQARPSSFKPPAPPPLRRMNVSMPAVNFTPPASPRITMSQAASQIGGNQPTINPITAAATNCCCAACTGLQCLDRTRFFSGQLLTDADLNNEQSYVLAKNRLHNLYLHGSGVVCGLQVTCGECPGWVNISPGYAIDPCGNDIIVCSTQSFNVLQAIQNCCALPTQATNCSPARYSPPPTCFQQPQTWCITIQYQEQQSNMVTPLQPVTSGSSCGCGTTSCVCGGCAGGNKMRSGGCGCGCQGSGSSGCGCGSSAATCTTSSTSSTAAACQATRILESFQLGVCQQSTATLSPVIAPRTSGNANTMEPFAGYQPLKNVVTSRPVFLDSSNNPKMSASQAYQASNLYLISALNAYATAGIQNCQGYDGLNRITFAQPPSTPQVDSSYFLALQTNVDKVSSYTAKRTVERLCAAMLPPCPPTACDSRLILACVTVCNGKIMDICQLGGGRKLLVGFPTIAYWLSLFSYGKFSASFQAALERLCCEESEFTNAFFNIDTSPEVMVSGTLGTSSMFNRMVASYTSQILGSDIVNAVSQVNTVDLRQLVGSQWSTVQTSLQNSNILPGNPGANTTTNSNVTYTDVSADPAWSDDAVASAPSYAPAAFQVKTPPNPLTVYYKGKTAGTTDAATTTSASTMPDPTALVVGFAITSTNDILTGLSAQVLDLENRIKIVNDQIRVLQNPPTPPPAPAPPAQSVEASAKPGKKK
jgi:hypothetical protein